MKIAVTIHVADRDDVTYAIGDDAVDRDLRAVELPDGALLMLVVMSPAEVRRQLADLERLGQDGARARLAARGWDRRVE